MLEETLPYHQKWLSRPLMQQAKSWTLEGLQESLVGLRRVDRLLKSSTIPEDQVLEEWLLGLMAREKERPA